MKYSDALNDLYFKLGSNQAHLKLDQPLYLCRISVDADELRVDLCLKDDAGKAVQCWSQVTVQPRLSEGKVTLRVDITSTLCGEYRESLGKLLGTQELIKIAGYLYRWVIGREYEV